MIHSNDIYENKYFDIIKHNIYILVKVEINIRKKIYERKNQETNKEIDT